MEQIRRLRFKEFSKVAEFVDRSNFVQKTLKKEWKPEKLDFLKTQIEVSKLNPNDIKRTLNGGLLTYLLHW